MPNVPSDKARSFFQNRRRETIGTLYVTLAQYLRLGIPRDAHRLVSALLITWHARGS